MKDPVSCGIMLSKLKIKKWLFFYYLTELERRSGGGSHCAEIGKGLNILNDRVELHEENEGPTRIKSKFMPKADTTIE